jgi:NAD(P)-dependent dehydrogenase (short-subunit alcohol dehydrogenase family)
MEGKFWSQYLCARHAQVGRSIMLFSGGYSRRPAQGVSIVAAINGAIEALGRALAVELAPVRVNVVSPGLIQGTAAYAGMPEAARAGMYAGAAARLPAGIVGDADSVAGPALALLASP